MTIRPPLARRRLALAGAVPALALAFAACSGPATPTSAPATGSAPPASASPTATGVPMNTSVTGDIEFWHFFTDREAGVLQTAVDNFMTLYPGIKVTVKSGQDDEKMRQAIAAGQPIDVGLSYSTDQVGPLCSSGAFVDLAPYIAKDAVDLNQIAPVAQSYTQFKGTRCSLPALADAYALYYNKDMFEAAGIANPPKTLDELTADAVKLTQYNTDGSIKVAGLLPLFGYYEFSEAHVSAMAQAKWLNEDGTSAIGSDPNWQTLYTWQKDLVDKLGGYDKVNKFMSGLGQEFSEQNDFQTGRVAMNIDGEFRTAFIADQAPKLNYGTAPLPVSSDHADTYGAGYITGNIIGIGKGSQNPDAAWEFVKYLALNTDAQVQVGNGLKNVPTIASALASPDLEVSEQYRTFLDVYAHANSVTTPPSSIGAEYQNILATFSQDWQSGKQTDLAGGLKAVDEQINAAVQLGG